MKRPQFEIAALTLEAHLAEGLGVAAGLPCMDPDLVDLRGKLRTYCDSAGLGIVVAGGEGTGKSRLVNGLVGRTVTPEEGAGAGTVAPVVLEYGASAHPVYRIDFRDGSSTKVSEESFRHHILQAHNPGNRKNVARGVVGFSSQILADGLVLTDTPGTRGADATIRDEVEKLFEGAAFSVLGLCADREYAPLIDIIVKSRIAPKQIVGIVNSVSDLFFPEDPQDCARRIEERRRAILDVFAQEGVPLEPSQVFIIHLSSLAKILRHDAPPVSHDAHRAEVQGLREKLQAAAHGFDFKPHFEAAKQLALTLMEPFSEEMSRRGVLWKGCFRRRGVERDAFEAALTQAEDFAKREWSQAMEASSLIDARKDAVRLMGDAVKRYVSGIEREQGLAFQRMSKILPYRLAALDEMVAEFNRQASEEYRRFVQAGRRIAGALIDAGFGVGDGIFSKLECLLPLCPSQSLDRTLTDYDEAVIEEIILKAVPPPPIAAVEKSWIRPRAKRRDAVRRTYAAVAALADGQGGMLNLLARDVAAYGVKAATPRFEDALAGCRAGLEERSAETKDAQSAFDTAEAAYWRSIKAISSM